MAQTPTQRRANAKYANQQQTKMGSVRPPKADREERRKMELSSKFKNSSVPKWVVFALLFVLCGGILFEMLKLFF